MRSKPSDIGLNDAKTHRAQHLYSCTQAAHIVFTDYFPFILTLLPRKWALRSRIYWCRLGPLSPRLRRPASYPTVRTMASLFPLFWDKQTASKPCTTYDLPLYHKPCWCRARVLSVRALCPCVLVHITFCLSVSTLLCCPRILLPHNFTQSSLFVHSSPRFSFLSGNRLWSFNGLLILVSFTKQFKYLGSLMADKPTDDAECDARISAASKAFGALKSQLFGVCRICTRDKKQAYEAFVLSLLFYGSECWIISDAKRDKILKFHRRCIRFMCCVHLDVMRSKNIHHTDLEKWLRISDVLSILESRRLEWPGHAYRMPVDRMPRLFLSSWVTHSRPKGRPLLIYGHGLAKDLKTYGLCDTWGTLALDRVS
jgi:hypothetical protein